MRLDGEDDDCVDADDDDDCNDVVKWSASMMMVVGQVIMVMDDDIQMLAHTHGVDDPLLHYLLKIKIIIIKGG